MLLSTYACLPAVAADVTGSAALTSDYVWRGSSQSDGDPAGQIGAKVAAASGWYAAGWGSSVRFDAVEDAHTEFDLSAGWAGALSDDLALDVNLTRYVYPSTTVDLDWTEAIAMLTWREAMWLQVGHSRDALASGDAGTYAHAQLGAVWALRAPFELRATWHVTDNAAKRLFPGAAGDRLEIALQGSF